MSSMEISNKDLVHNLLVDLCKAAAHPLVEREKLLADINKTFNDFKNPIENFPEVNDDTHLSSKIHDYLWNEYKSGKLFKTEQDELPTQTFVKFYKHMCNNLPNATERAAILEFLYNLAGKNLEFSETVNLSMPMAKSKNLLSTAVDDDDTCIKVGSYASDAALGALSGQFYSVSVKEFSTNGFLILNDEYNGIFTRLLDICENYNFLLPYTAPEGPLGSKGLMGRSMTYCLKMHLNRYQEVISIIEKNFNEKKSLGFHNQLSLTELVCLASEPWTHLKWLTVIVKQCTKKPLSKALFDMFPNGSHIATNYISMFLVSIVAPLYKMITSWMFESIIVDPYNEFFIEQKTNVHVLSSWYDKYTICLEKLPPFISLDVAEKILTVGKSFEILLSASSLGLCNIWGQREFQTCFKENPDYILRRNNDTELHMILDHLFLRISAQILQIFTVEHKLFEHLYGMRNYSLLGHSLFIEYLMTSMHHELNKPAITFYDYDVFTEVDRCIGVTNIHKKDKDIRYCMDCNLLLPSMGNTGWDIFLLQYIVNGSLSIILKPFAKICDKLFRPLWRIKHTEFILQSIIWRNQRYFGRKLRTVLCELDDIMKILQSTTIKMMHFIQELVYYIFFEVIECAWREFQNTQKKCPKTFDEIFNAYQKFLTTVNNGIFLNDVSKNEHIQIIDKIYSLVMNLEKWQNLFYDCCSFELIAREYFNNYMKRKVESNFYGIDVYVIDERANSKSEFNNAICRQTELLVKIVEDFQQEVIKFIQLIYKSNEPDLKSFAMRLNFNEYYIKE